MKDLIHFVAQAIVDLPDEVEVREVERGRRLELLVADADLGRIIGRRGRTAQAMRTLLRASAKNRGSVDLEIIGREESGAE
jgi:predicted RNA-binding protein YlqC (UPF0109 family)